MPKIARACLVIVAFLLFSSQTYAQSKIAYMDANALIKKLPEALDAEVRLDQLVSSWNKEAEDIQNELNRKRTDFERRKLIMTDAERTSVEVELQNLKKRLDDFRQSKYGNNGEIFSQQSSLMKPAYDKLLKAVEEVAKEGGYDYVIDRSSQGVTLLYANSRHDLTAQVAKKLGIETELFNQPLLNTPGSNTPPGNTPPIRQQPPPKPLPNGQSGQPGGQVPAGQFGQPGSEQVPGTNPAKR